MTDAERRKITDEGYADLIINYSGDQKILDQYKNNPVNIINYFNAVVYVPVSQITDHILVDMGYSVMPLPLGLVSQLQTEVSGIDRLRSMPNFNLRGQGVLIGILDTGIDYQNPIFKYSDNTTRIVSIWDQTIFSNNYPSGFNYGTIYTREQINQALQNEKPLSIVPSKDEIGHGTMLAGIATGKEATERGFTGVAPDAELVVVKLKQAKKYLRDFFLIPENVPCYQTNDLMFAFNYVYALAYELNKPMAICIGVNTSLNAHDGRALLSSYLSLRAGSAGFGIVIAAGNEGNARRHFYSRVSPKDGYKEVELSVGADEPGFAMELWGTATSAFSIDVQTPSGEYVPRIVPILDETRLLTFIFEPTVINIDNQLIESESGDQLILMRFHKPSQGIWRFKVYVSGNLPADFHIWLPMKGFISDNTYFIHSDPYTTILALGNSRDPICVTAYNAADESLYSEASRGYTRIGVIKPEIAAPGVKLLSPGLNNNFIEVSGTSAAAAYTTGVAALLLEWAVVKNNQPTMNTLDMKIFMIRGGKRNAEMKYPNQDWGFGILDVYNIFDALRMGNGSL